MQKTRRPVSALATLAAGVLLSAAVGCGDDARDEDGAAALTGARELTSFTPGAQAGFGQEAMPDVVLGLPRGGRQTAGGLDVVSLGVGGEITLAFGDRAIIDGPGPDFIVFENAFWPGGDATRVFAELGEVSVSEDGERWVTFACSTTPSAPGQWPGCAGWRPTLAAPDEAPVDPTALGGDPFDLADVGLSRARYVRVRDLSEAGAAETAGFDLDAIAAIHLD